MVAVKTLASAFVVGLVMLPACFSQTPNDTRWAYRTPGSYSGLPSAAPKTQCGSLQYFSENPGNFEYLSDLRVPQRFAVSDSVSSNQVGVIAGFAVYVVIHNIEYDKSNEMSRTPTYIKLILVERKPGEFCAIFNEQGMRAELGSVEPAYFVDVDSQKILCTRDPINGSAGGFQSMYWTFDEDGPIVLDTGVIGETLNKLLPYGVYAGRGTDFDIQALTFAGPVTKATDALCCPTGGSVRIKLAIRNHQLAVISQEFDPTPVEPYGVPSKRITVDGAIQALRLIQQVLPVVPPLVQQVRGLGNVVMRAIIHEDGSVEPGPIVLNGNPYLASLAVPALEAVRQWRYSPTLVNGDPVEVETTITVTFPGQ